MKKNPWIAAMLNFFFIGLGTLYDGYEGLARLRREAYNPETLKVGFA